MSSNLKGKSSGKESPTEPFKRAVTGCLRAIAKKHDLEVAFAAVSSSTWRETSTTSACNFWMRSRRPVTSTLDCRDNWSARN